MMSTTRRRTHPIDDPLLHLTGPFAPSPTASPTHSPATHFHHVPSAASAAASAPPCFSLFGLATVPLPRITPTGAPDPARVHPALRWAVSPAAALRLLLLPPLLALPTHYLLPLLRPLLPSYLTDVVGNPFTPFFLLSHLSPPPARLSAAAPLPDPRTGVHGPLYVKGPGDLLLVAYAVVLFSFLRLVLSHYLLPALGRRGGIRKEGKLLRFGEQGYSVVYFAVVGVWGVYTMSTTRTLWFRTPHFWLDYPHTHLSGAMKRYYLGQVGFWVQQFLVLTLALEKRRSDHWELVLHHCVTVWMVSWSYLMNVTLLGSAVFMSMDIPDMMLSFSKMLNYLNLMRAKVVSLAVFFVVWTYFRHYISIRILWSLRYEFHLVPEEAQVFAPMRGLYMALWMRDQMFYSLCVLQALNLFWYYLILRIIVRSIMTSETDDNRSDEDEDESVSIPKPAPVSLHAVPELQLSEKGLRASIGREKPRGAGARAGTLGQGLSVQTNANENGHANGNGNGFYGGCSPYAGKGMGKGKTLVDVEAAGLFQDPTGKEE